MNIKRKLLGRKGNDGLLFQVIIYGLLVGISFIFLYPLISMILTSFKSLQDLINPSVVWIPKHFTFSNYGKVFKTLEIWPRLKDTLILSVIPTLSILVSSSLIGYGFARFKFPLKNILFLLMIGIFLIPSILLSLPTYMIYHKLQLIGKLQAYVYPALFGFGINQPLFILIFYQFFKMIPRELDEAAQVDGASTFKIFTSIAIPIGGPAYLISGLYSFVWYWSETALAQRYLQGKYMSLPMSIESLRQYYERLYPATSNGMSLSNDVFNQSILFAAILISILPLLLIYLYAQKWFVEGIDRTGITGS